MTPQPAKIRRTTLVSLDDMRQLAALARYAIQQHDLATHRGLCDVCDLVETWRTRMTAAECRYGLPQQTPRRASRVRRAMRRNTE